MTRKSEFLSGVLVYAQKVFGKLQRGRTFCPFPRPASWIGLRLVSSVMLNLQCWEILNYKNSWKPESEELYRSLTENLKVKNFIVSSQNIFSTIYVWISTFNASNPGQYIHKNYKIKSGPHGVTTTWLDFLHVFFQSKRTDAHKVKTNTAQKMKSSINDFFSKCDHIHKNCGFGQIYWRIP